MNEVGMTYNLTKEATIEGLGNIFYVSAPIDISAKLLNKKFISARDLAFARIQAGAENSLCQNGSHVKEGDIYLPNHNNKIILVRNSAVLKAPKKAADAHRNGSEFFITEKEAEKYASQKDSFVIEDFSPVPTNRFGEDERTVWLFGDQAQNYGQLLNDNKISAMPFSFDGANHITNQKKPYANQLWLGGFDYNSRVDGDNRDLVNDYRARGVLESKSGVAGAQKHPASELEKICEGHPPARTKDILKIYKSIMELGKQNLNKYDPFLLTGTSKHSPDEVRIMREIHKEIIKTANKIKNLHKQL